VKLSGLILEGFGFVATPLDMFVTPIRVSENALVTKYYSPAQILMLVFLPYTSVRLRFLALSSPGKETTRICVLRRFPVFL
jgi:hypothetical protein